MNRAEHAQAGTEQENSRGRDATPLFWIEEVPLTYHAPFGIAQDWELKAVSQADGFAAVRRVHGQRGQPNANGLECVVVFGKLRQLAKAEWSPASAIENQDELVTSGEVREPSRSAR